MFHIFYNTICWDLQKYYSFQKKKSNVLFLGKKFFCKSSSQLKLVRYTRCYCLCKYHWGYFPFICFAENVPDELLQAKPMELSTPKDIYFKTFLTYDLCWCKHIPISEENMKLLNSCQWFILIIVSFKKLFQ